MLLQTKHELTQMLKRQSIPIRGVFQGAGVLHDGVFDSQTADTITKVVAPKLEGTLNLHECFKDIKLDYFVMHSSVASLIGNPGQTNYAAANSFLDSFAAYRRSIGMNAQSINWGALEVGMATDKVVQQRLAHQGIKMIDKERIVKYLLYALENNPVGICFADFDWEVLSISLKGQNLKYRGFTSKYSKESHRPKVKVHTPAELMRMTIKSKRLAVKQIVGSIISDLIITDQVDIDETESLPNLGIDSLATSGIKNNILEQLNVTIPDVILQSGSTSIGDIIDYCCNALNDRTPELNARVEFVEEKVAFTQIPDLVTYKATPGYPGLTYLIDIETKGYDINSEQFNGFVLHLLSKFPDLRSTYNLREDLVRIEGIETIRLESIIAETNYEDLARDVYLHTDQRYKFAFDLEREYPIKFVIGRSKDKMVIRMVIHKIVSDMHSISLIFAEMKSYFTEKKDPEELSDVKPRARQEINKLVMQTRELGLKYWFSRVKNVEITSMSQKALELDKNLLTVSRTDIDRNLYKEIMYYLDRKKYTLYQFFSVAYALLLHARTGNKNVTFTTDADLRHIVPAITKEVVRGINVIPCIVTVDPKMTLQQFAKETKTRLVEDLEHRMLPFQDIVELLPIDIRPHIGRHYLLMNDMKNLNNLGNSDTKSVTIENVWIVRPNKESTCQIMYDQQRTNIMIVMYYNSLYADGSLLDQMLTIIQSIVRNEDLTVGQLVSKSPSHITNFSSVNKTATVTNVPERNPSTETSNKNDRSKRLTSKMLLDKSKHKNDVELWEIARGKYLFYVFYCVSECKANLRYV